MKTIKDLTVKEQFMLTYYASNERKSTLHFPLQNRTAESDSEFQQRGEDKWKAYEESQKTVVIMHTDQKVGSAYPPHWHNGQPCSEYEAPVSTEVQDELHMGQSVEFWITIGNAEYDWYDGFFEEFHKFYTEGLASAERRDASKVSTKDEEALPEKIKTPITNNIKKLSPEEEFKRKHSLYPYSDIDGKKEKWYDK